MAKDKLQEEIERMVKEIANAKEDPESNNQYTVQERGLIHRSKPSGCNE